MTHYTCDICGGKAIGNKFKLPWLQWKRRISFDSPMEYDGDNHANNGKEVDVCSKCAKEIALFIASKGDIPVAYSDYDMESDSL